MRRMLIGTLLVLAACQGDTAEQADRAIAAPQPDLRAFVEDMVNNSISELDDATLLARAAEDPLRARSAYLSLMRGSLKHGKFDRDYVINTALSDLSRRRVRELGDIISLDLDGDGNIDAAEIKRDLDGKRAREADRAQLQFRAIDLNEDGILSEDEARAFAIRKTLEKPDRVRRQIDELTSVFVFDGNRDGVVTVDEVTQGLAQLPAADTNQNTDEGCQLPAPSEQAEIISLSAYSSGTLSSVAIGNEDNEIQYSRIEIEAGDTPIYVTAKSYEGMIWAFSGATSRIEHFVAASSPSSDNAVGVIGLDDDQLTLLTGDDCLTRFKVQDAHDEAQAGLVMAKFLGRQPDRLIANNSSSDYFLPSGEVGQALLPYQRVFGARPNGVSAETWEAFTRFNKGGVARLDATRVIASQPARPYSVLPQQAGLVQLESEGKIRLVEGGVMRGIYVLLEPIDRWPTGLAGAHSVEFIVPRHIPMPTGYRGHSGVYVEATGACSGHGSMCSKVTKGAFETLLKQIAADAQHN